MTRPSLRATWSRRRRTALAALLTSALIGAATVPAMAEPADPLVDDFETPLSQGQDGAVPIGFFSTADPNSHVEYQATTPPEAVPGTDPATQALQMDFTVQSWGVVVHNFADETGTQWTHEDWSSYEGIQFWLHGTGSGTSLFLDVMDNRNPGSTTDDAERWSIPFTDDTAGWTLVQIPFLDMARKEVGNGAPNDGFTLTEVHGWGFGTLATAGTQTFYIDDVSLYGVAPEPPLEARFGTLTTTVTEGGTAVVPIRLSKPAETDVTIHVQSTYGTAVADVDYVPVDTVVTIPAGETEASVTVETIDNAKYQGERGLTLEFTSVDGAGWGKPVIAAVLIGDDDAYDPNLVEDFEAFPHLWDAGRKTTLDTTTIGADDALARPDQTGPEQVLAPTVTGNKLEISREFAEPQDFSGSDALSFWYYGQGTGRDVDVTLSNETQTTDAGDPASWELVWSDEFDAAAGTPPNPEYWSYEIGDGAALGKAGWGNDELQYYTDSTDAVAHDGNGNLVITVAETGDEAPLCYYGPCEYTSARLVTQNKVEFEYGRMEARLKVPSGAGLWPAFWSLGSDIVTNPWPWSGEIDFMEYVARDPNTVFGTIHGPGYSGGQSYGDTHTFDEPVANDWHTYSVTWSEDHIIWAVDGIEYHEAIPADVAPNEWVYNHPFFIILNMAVGGNFGGPVGADTQFPAEYLIDYVRVYQAPTQDVGYTVSFTDDVAGWSLVTLPVADFDGLDATAVSGFSLYTKIKPNRPVMLDELRLTCAASATVTTTEPSGPGSLASALAAVCTGGTVVVDPSLAGQTLALSSPLTLARDVTIEGAGLVLDGGGVTRVVEVAAGASVTLTDLTITGGYGWDLAGGVLTNGDLRLERVTVADNVVATDADDWWKGGGGVYVGGGGSLALVDSTVSGNVLEGGGNGGGVLVFQGATATIEGSTISGNSAANVGGGLRTMGEVTITGSTITGNTAVGWHGGAIFHTDATLTMTGSTVTDNTSPTESGGIFVGTFGEVGATLTYEGSTVTGNSGNQCIAFYGGSGPVELTSLGGNTVSDVSCGEPADGDVIG